MHSSKCNYFVNKQTVPKAKDRLLTLPIHSPRASRRIFHSYPARRPIVTCVMSNTKRGGRWCRFYVNIELTAINEIKFRTPTLSIRTLSSQGRFQVKVDDTRNSHPLCKHRHAPAVLAIPTPQKRKQPFFTLELDSIKFLLRSLQAEPQCTHF